MSLDKLIVAVALLVVSGCGGSGGDGSPQASPIVGTWSFVYQASQCEETYVFNNNNMFSGTSLDEVFSGVYTLNAAASPSGRMSLSINITRDNQQTDCEGSNSDDAGVAGSVFVEFPTATQMDWYIQSAGGTPEVTLTKR